ncbi:uncharacterized protein EpC_36990 [Erwinia pyrifoliae Ep1/96]|nr:uncharacterized protein EpC_36990 [Erwinia pyrifoliae Ep1/96]
MCKKRLELQKKNHSLPLFWLLKNEPPERKLNNCSPFHYLSIEITGAHRIICTVFAALLKRAKAN